MGKRYTLAELVRLQKILKSDGTPYQDIGGVRRRLLALGIERTQTNDKGVLIYSITEKQIKKINKGRK